MISRPVDVFWGADNLIEKMNLNKWGAHDSQRLPLADLRPNYSSETYELHLCYWHNRFCLHAEERTHGWLRTGLVLYSSVQHWILVRLSPEGQEIDTNELNGFTTSEKQERKQDHKSRFCVTFLSKPRFWKELQWDTSKSNLVISKMRTVQEKLQNVLFLHNGKFCLFLDKTLQDSTKIFQNKLIFWSCCVRAIGGQRRTVPFCWSWCCTKIKKKLGGLANDVLTFIYVFQFYFDHKIPHTFWAQHRFDFLGGGFRSRGALRPMKWSKVRRPGSKRDKESTTILCSLIESKMWTTLALTWNTCFRCFVCENFARKISRFEDKCFVLWRQKKDVF